MKIKNAQRKIGIMGGTFDPIHYGHLMLAEQVRTKFDLDYIYFIPAGIPPHKNNDWVQEKAHRYAMTLLATSTNPYFLVSDIEVKKDHKTYTIDTIEEILDAKDRPSEIFFITGADAIIALESWKSFEKLLGICKFVGATRPGVDTRAVEEKIEYFNEVYHAEIEMLMVPALSISSTDIRCRVAENRSIKYLLPEAVEAYIVKNDLYKDTTLMEMEHLLKRRLSSKRYNHSMRVKNEAERLAIRYGADLEKAKLAGLLHDYAKEMRDEAILALLEKEGLEIDESIKVQPDIAHGEVGALLLKEDFNIEDIEILDAVKWHTYGHEDMKLLDKIIFIADAIEPGRNYLGIDRIREATYKDIDSGILMYIKDCKAFLKEQGKPMHKNTLALEKRLIKEKKDVSK